ncbi:hypothetical protein CYY_000298 [Polysphondylium violaceum]|uniref:Signal recognition particle subunit SRP72 n=1 Tax=Polysphondylium violaceum TaxID=133409 RepID=A0A8J4QBB7_9MYCE|nr:hypothetical protein CYY_000298 [Polysphondylium violaceum]
MSKETVSLDQLFKDLDENINNGQYKKAIRVCNKILGINNKDVEAFQCKVIACMQLGNYQEALDCFKTNPTQIESMRFEYAYCLYSIKKYQEALKEIEKSSKENRILELEAQIYYKLENPQKTLSIYESLLGKPGYADSVEFITNLCATYIEANEIQKCQEFLTKNKQFLAKAYELAFNAACLSIIKQDYKTAETQLKLAKKVCSDSLKRDGYTEEEIKKEMTAIDVQLAYCQQITNNLESALEIYQNIVDYKIEDDSASLVALNNIASLRDAEKDSATILESIKNLLSEPQERLLNGRQKKTIGFNLAILLVNLRKVGQFEELVKSLKSKNAADQISTPEQINHFTQELDIISASLMIKEKKWKDAEQLLKSSKTLKSKLLLAQLYLLDGNHIEKTISVLENLESQYKSKPGVIATLVALYEKSGDLDKSIQYLDQMIGSLESKSKKSEQEQESYLNLLRISGNFKMNHQKHKEAAETYEKILQVNPNDLIALPSYIVATSHYDPTLAQKYESKLPNIKFESKVDVDLIEKYGLAYDKKESESNTTLITDKKPSTTTTAAVGEKKPKKKLPKNYKPGDPIDPDRWLPKWQRSSNKNKGKGKKSTIGKGPQGVTSAAQLESLFVKESSEPKVSNTVTVKADKPRNIHKKKTLGLLCINIITLNTLIVHGKSQSDIEVVSLFLKEKCNTVSLGLLKEQDFVEIFCDFIDHIISHDIDSVIYFYKQSTDLVPLGMAVEDAIRQKYYNKEERPHQLVDTFLKNLEINTQSYLLSKRRQKDEL